MATKSNKGSTKGAVALPTREAPVLGDNRPKPKRANSLHSPNDSGNAKTKEKRLASAVGRNKRTELTTDISVSLDHPYDGSSALPSPRLRRAYAVLFRVGGLRIPITESTDSLKTALSDLEPAVATEVQSRLTAFLEEVPSNAAAKDLLVLLSLTN